MIVVEPEAAALADSVPVTPSELTPLKLTVCVPPSEPSVAALRLDPLLSERLNVPPVPPVSPALRSVIDEPAAGVRVKLNVLLAFGVSVIGPAVNPPAFEPDVIAVMLIEV